jgi:hypothetical protein
MKFRFIGDPRNNGSGPDAFVKFDLAFSRDEWTEVDDPSVIRKLLGSDHYEAETYGEMIEPKRRGGWPKGRPRKPKTVETEDDIGEDTQSGL